jgi:hypothetical protein
MMSVAYGLYVSGCVVGEQIVSGEKVLRESGERSPRRIRLKLPTSPGLPGPYGNLAASSVT